MTTRNNPRGFVEHRKLGGGGLTSTRRYKRKADGASGAFAIAAGDPVVLVSGHSIARLGAAATAAQVPVIGIVRAVYNSNGRPLTHNLPESPVSIPASTAGEVDVNIDPFQTYLVSTDATVVSTLVGQYVQATANAAGTAAGRSGFQIEVAGAANTAAATLPFQVVGIGANNLSGLVGGEANQDIEVMLARPGFGHTNKVR